MMGNPAATSALAPRRGDCGRETESAGTSGDHRGPGLVAVSRGSGCDAGIGLHGLALGMTPEQASAGIALPCTSPPYSSSLTCHDATDGSDYSASFSGGSPSVALVVAHSFCTHDDPADVRTQVLAVLHAPDAKTAPDPNGFYVDLDAHTEAILNADDGTCHDGRGKHDVLSLRSDALITTVSKKATERAKKALR